MSAFARHGTEMERARARILAYSVPEPNSGCWLWERSLLPQGYAISNLNNRNVLGHRLSYQAFKGPIPAELQIDHLCGVECCVNPDHLEAVSRQVNMDRSPRGRGKPRVTHCKYGHELTDENVLWDKGRGYPRRYCRLCHNAKTAKRNRMKRAARRGAK